MGDIGKKWGLLNSRKQSKVGESARERSQRLSGRCSSKKQSNSRAGGRAN